MKNRIAAIAVVGMLVTHLQPACAQQPISVAAVLDAGGKKLTKDELLRLYSGATVSGVQASKPDTQFEVRYNADGSVSGKAWGPWGNTIVSGKWSINDQGQHCNDLRNSAGNVIAGCQNYFLLESRYYSAKTDERWQPVYERRFTR